MRKGLRKPYRIVKDVIPCIDERPKKAKKRIKIGHWEDDSIVYTPSCPVRLRTSNELVSGVVFIAKTRNRTMADGNRITNEQLGFLPSRVLKTLSRDCGAENMGYEEQEQDLGIRCVLTRPYHFWERGSNENVNGLIRRFFSKKTDFCTITD
jgi:transposase, IS30 family